MQSRAKLLGHPVHPMLVAFPIGLLAASLVFDLIAMAGGPTQLGFAAFWCIAGGVVFGLLAAVFGLVDWLGIEPGTRAKRVGLWHAIINVIVVGLFSISWLVRLGVTQHQPMWFPVALEIVAIVLLLISGWLGGELVDRLGIGIDDGAHPNARSSLRDKHA